jgi:hypothetical protein
MKPMLKAPGTQRLHLSYDELAFNFAFNFIVRRYTEQQTYFADF